MRKLISESRKLEKSARELQRRRLNWRMVTKNQIESYFKEVCSAAKEHSYPFFMVWSVHDEAEKGAALVASFASNGSVAFIIYPYKSERYSRNEDNIILYHSLSPDAVTMKLVKSCVSKYLLYVRNSSIYGGYSSSFLDFVRINMMIAVDIRNRKNLYRTAYGMLAEWSKVIGAGIAGYIVAVLTRGS